VKRIRSIPFGPEPDETLDAFASRMARMIQRLKLKYEINTALRVTGSRSRK
jgi:hypothetical protein